MCPHCLTATASGAFQSQGTLMRRHMREQHKFKDYNSDEVNDYLYKSRLVWCYKPNGTKSWQPVTHWAFTSFKLHSINAKPFFEGRWLGETSKPSNGTPNAHWNFSLKTRKEKVWLRRHFGPTRTRLHSKRQSLNRRTHRAGALWRVRAQLLHLERSLKLFFKN